MEPLFYLFLIVVVLVVVVLSRRQQGKLWERNQSRADEVTKQSLDNQQKMIRLLQEIRDRIKT
jgi:hypothetical protein